MRTLLPRWMVRGAATAVLTVVTSCAYSVVDETLYSTPRKVTLKDDVYVNTGYLDEESLEGTRSSWYDSSRQNRVAHLRAGSDLMIEGLRHDRRWFLIDSYTVLECRPVDNPDLGFDYTVGVDGKLMPSSLAW